VAIRGAASCRQRRQRLAGLRPETRTMAIALGGRPDDSAKMV
jgi:hypothetical protein